MGWRFRKSIKIAPGIKINIGKKGISSLSVGPRGAHINVGKNGTSVSTGIPGTGLYNVTRLDKPAGRGMTQCPYCGHKMRKQWDACPQCHTPLVRKEASASSQEPINVTTAGSDRNIIDADICPSKNTEDKNGCGCLVIFLIIMLIGSCMAGSGTKKADTTSSKPAAVTTQTSSTSSSSGKSNVAPVPISTQNTKQLRQRLQLLPHLNHHQTMKRNTMETVQTEKE